MASDDAGDTRDDGSVTFATQAHRTAVKTDSRNEPKDLFATDPRLRITSGYRSSYKAAVLAAGVKGRGGQGPVHTTWARRSAVYVPKRGDRFTASGRDNRRHSIVGIVLANMIGTKR